MKTIACAGQDAGAGGLKEITLAPWGRVKSTNGEFLIDADGVAAIEKAFIDHGVDLVIDYDHATLGGQYATPSGKAPAAGWIRKIYSEYGVALKGLVEWTDEAREEIRSGKFRYLSPVMLVRVSDRRAIAIHSAAVTNKPAIPASERLAASARDPLETVPMTGMAGEPAVKADPYMVVGEIAILLGVKTKDGSDFVDTLVAIRDALRVLKESGDEKTSAIASDRLSVLDFLACAEESTDSPMSLVGKLRDMLGLAEDAKAVAVLQAVIAKLESVLGEKDETDADDDGESGSGEDKVAASVAKITGPLATEVAVMKAELRTRDVQDILEPYVLKGALNKQYSRDDYEDFVALAAVNPALCRRMLDVRVAAQPPPGRTTPPSSRSTLMSKALSEYRDDESMQKVCSAKAAIDQKLRDAGQETMTDQEATEFSVA